MTKDDVQAFAAATAELIGAKFDALREDLLTEVQGARAAAERAAEHGIEANTRLTRVEESLRKHGVRLDDHQEDLTRLGASVFDLLGRVTALETPQTKKERVG
jgi:hypothetical protein